MNFLLIPIGALCLALFPLPYDAYAMVRWIVFVFAVLAGYKLHQIKIRDIRWYGLIAVGIVFNPFVPFYLSRGLRMTLDVAAIGFLSFVAVRGTSSSEPGLASERQAQKSVLSESARHDVLTKAEKAGDKFAQQVAITGLLALIVLLLITIALRR